MGTQYQRLLSFPYKCPPSSLVFPLSLLPVRAAQVTRYHTLMHHLSSWGWALVARPTEERRLAAEEGSLSKNTWSQKIARGFSVARRAPEKGPSHRVTFTPTLSHSLSHSVTRSQVVMPTEERRLAAEEGSLPKN